MLTAPRLKAGHRASRWPMPHRGARRARRRRGHAIVCAGGGTTGGTTGGPSAAPPEAPLVAPLVVPRARRHRSFRPAAVARLARLRRSRRHAGRRAVSGVARGSAHGSGAGSVDGASHRGLPAHRHQPAHPCAAQFARRRPRVRAGHARRACRHSGAKAEHVSDTHLAAIAIDLDAELVTAGRGFARYAGLR